MDNTSLPRQVLYVLSADKHFLSVLNKSLLTGYVEQVFNKAINIYLDNTLFTLLCSAVDDAPNSCRVLLNDFSVTNINQGDTAFILNHQLIIEGKYTLTFKLCQLWYNQPLIFDTKKLLEEQYNQYLLNTILKLDQLLNKTNRSLFNYQGNNLFYLALSQQLIKERNRFISAIKTSNHTQLMTATRHLVGLGIGLTPSGDDYLVGWIIILSVSGHPLNSIAAMLSDVIQANKRNTTQLSLITLEKALQQEYREHLYQFISKLIAGIEKDIQQDITNIINIGSSSGCDMLVGLRDALYLTHCFGVENVHQNCY